MPLVPVTATLLLASEKRGMDGRSRSIVESKNESGADRKTVEESRLGDE